jgi:hypothetical protein
MWISGQALQLELVLPLPQSALPQSWHAYLHCNLRRTSV